MSEQTTAAATQATPEANGTPVPEQAQTGRKPRQQHKLTEQDKKARGAFTDKAKAEATKPDHPNYRLFAVVIPDAIPAGTYYAWDAWLACPAWLASLGATADWVGEKAKNLSTAGEEELLAETAKRLGISVEQLKAMKQAQQPAPEQQPATEKPASGKKGRK
jgi:hypothetical protein